MEGPTRRWNSSEILRLEREIFADGYARDLLVSHIYSRITRDTWIIDRGNIDQLPQTFVFTLRSALSLSPLAGTLLICVVFTSKVSPFSASAVKRQLKPRLQSFRFACLTCFAGLRLRPYKCRFEPFKMDRSPSPFLVSETNSLQIRR